MKNRGFTLIELLVVIAIVGVLAALVLPAVYNTRSRAHTATCMNNIKQIAAAAFMYAEDHGEEVPEVSELTEYLDDEDVFVCPRDTRSGVGASKPSYTVWAGTPTTLLPGAINGLFSERALYIESDKEYETDWSEITDGDVDYRHDGKSVAVFADGHVYSYRKDETAKLLMLIGETSTPK